MLSSMHKIEQIKSKNWLDLLIFIIFANVFLFHAFGSVALGLILVGTWVLLIRIFDHHKGETKNVVLLGSGTLAITIAMYLMVNSAEKAIILIFVVLMIMFVSVYIWLKQGSIDGILELGLSWILIIKEYMRSAWRILNGIIKGNLRQILLSGQAKKEKSPWVKSILVGFVVGLPIIVWLVSTLSKADPVFSTYVQNILSKEFLAELPMRIFISTFLFIVLVPSMVMKWVGYESPLGWLTKVRWSREMTVVTIMVVIVMGVFLIVQWPYVFANVVKETDLSKYGVATYSEYVQKGFSDLIKVVVMVFVVAWAGLLINKNQSGSERKFLMKAQALLGVEFIVFIVSIFRRVWLYQNYHGLTLARLYGLALLVGISGMMVTMALRYVHQNVRWVKVEAGWILLVIFTTIGLNMEALVVKDPPTVNKRVDYVYLSRLSSDGKDGWLQAYQWAKHVLDKNSANGNQIGKDDRRDIFYAGLITRGLTSNYHSLILQYGSDDEVKNYFRQVIYVNEQIAVEVPMSDKQWLSDLDKTDWVDRVNVTPTPMIAPTWDYGFPNYKAHQNDRYYYIQGAREKERLVGLDRILAYDPLRNRVYTWMKQEMGFDQLLEMQKQDFRLQKRIAAQPEAERDFDIDISLDSPFLR